MEYFYRNKELRVVSGTIDTADREPEKVIRFIIPDGGPSASLSLTEIPKLVEALHKIVEIEPSDEDYDNLMAVEVFAHAMAIKMGEKQKQGRTGWRECSTEDLWKMLREHVEKGDPVDIANFAMMIYHNR